MIRLIFSFPRIGCPYLIDTEKCVGYFKTFFWGFFNARYCSMSFLFTIFASASHCSVVIIVTVTNADTNISRAKKLQRCYGKIVWAIISGSIIRIPRQTTIIGVFDFYDIIVHQMCTLCKHCIRLTYYFILSAHISSGV